MRKFLNDFITTLGFQGQKRAYAVLDEARLEKAQVNVIAQKLADQGPLATLQFRQEEHGAVIGGAATSISLRDAIVRLDELYDTSNNLDLVLKSNISILTADIKALDDELTALEKSSANYSFLLSDGGSYDYAYIESFSDSRNLEDSFEFLIPDRAGGKFSDLDMTAVLADEGTIALPQATIRRFPLTGRVLESNVSSLVTSSSALSGALNTLPSTGWRLSISSPSPITSWLPSFTRLYPDNPAFIFPGVNVTLELVLPSPSPCDHIRLAPFSDTKLDIVQIEIYEDLEGTKKKALLGAPIELNSVKSIYFDLQPVSKVKVFVRQLNYNRNGVEPITSEEKYRLIYEEKGTPYNPINNPNTIKRPLADSQKWTRTSFISRLVQKHLFKRDDNKYKIAFPLTLYAPSWGSSKEELMKIFTNHRDPARKWSDNSVQTSFVEQIIFSRLPPELRASFMPRTIQPGDDKSLRDRPYIYPYVPISPKRPSPPFVPRQQFKYQYSVGFQSIALGTSVTGQKGVFVSKILPSPGDVGEVRIKVEDENFVETPTARHQPRLTSTEYSVTNQAVPDDEKDWAPIMPVGQSTVTAERFFPDSIGKGLFRFEANLEENIILYKNGYEVNDLDLNDIIIRSATKQTAQGMILPIGYTTAQDIFVVDYVPAGDLTVINFEKAGYETAPMVSSFDADGAGEGFLGTNGQLIIDLKYEPFINYDEVEDATYIDGFGLSGYNPVTVILGNGTTALNLTNYKGGDQAVLNASSATSFIQNANSLMFNAPVEQEFRVYYQYLPNNLRFRAVLRSNTKGLISPKTDMLQVKAKTRKADAKKAS